MLALLVELIRLAVEAFKPEILHLAEDRRAA
jgi:hypothetical protein